MRRAGSKLAILSLSIGIIALGPAPRALGAFDQTPPTLTVGVRPLFVVGDVVEDYTIEQYWYANDIAQLIQWSATDDVGVCSYDLFAVPSGAPPIPLLEFSQDTQYTFLAGDYVDDFGGGSFHIDGFLVTARDCTGNATTRAITDRDLLVIQEDGSSATAAAWPQPIAYTGSWTRANCACFLAEHTAFTRAPGARATFTRVYQPGDRIALVMALGPGRGTFGIRVDGRWVTTIDTFAATNTNRVVVFEQELTPGPHTVVLVNHATAGRSRIDLDAILIGTQDPVGTGV